MLHLPPSPERVRAPSFRPPPSAAIAPRRADVPTSPFSAAGTPPFAPPHPYWDPPLPPSHTHHNTHTLALRDGTRLLGMPIAPHGVCGYGLLPLSTKARQPPPNCARPANARHRPCHRPSHRQPRSCLNNTTPYPLLPPPPVRSTRERKITKSSSSSKLTSKTRS